MGQDSPSTIAHLETCKGGCSELSLMKTGALHNDPYCFYRLEHKLFARELKNPFKRLWFSLYGKAGVRSGAFSRLGGIFGGKKRSA